MLRVKSVKSLACILSEDSSLSRVTSEKSVLLSEKPRLERSLYFRGKGQPDPSFHLPSRRPQVAVHLPLTNTFHQLVFSKTQKTFCCLATRWVHYVQQVSIRKSEGRVKIYTVKMVKTEMACAPPKTCQNQKSFWIPSNQPPNTCTAGCANFFLQKHVFVKHPNVQCTLYINI